MFGMFGTKPLDVPDTSSDPTLAPPSNPTATNTQGEPIEDLVYSTPRSELNNPMADQELLDEASKANKDGDGTAETKTTGTPATTSPILKRADPKDLPSYPSRGVQNLEASAGKAALLAASQSKSPELWRPDRLPAAGAAASLANTATKSPEPWNPGPLPAASAAAVLAGDSKPPEVWQPSTPSISASKAASSVNERKSTMSDTKRSPPQSTANALAAAGMANSPKKLSKPAPKSPPTPAYDINKVNALAAQKAQKHLSSQSQPRAALSQSQTDKNMSDILRAASISMNKNLSKSPPGPTNTSSPRPAMSSTTPMPPGSYYSHIPVSPPKVQPEPDKKLNRKSSTQAASIAASSDLHSVISQESDERQIRYYPHLEEAARKAASERLARLQAEHDRARQASGLPPSWTPAQGTRPRSSTAPSATKAPQPGATRAAAAAKPATIRKQPDASDYARSMKIKSDTAKLGRQIDSVDKDKQAKDYLALLAVAEKNVKSRMQDLETKVATDQGRVPKHLQAEWDAKAKMLSAENERKRTEEKEKVKGKINMGGGLWYDEEDLERIARGNVQPILDEINEKAEKERARVEQLRLEKEQADRERKVEADRVAGVKAEVKKAKVLEKNAAKSRREAEKAEERERKAELKKAQKEEKERLKAEKQSQKGTTVAAAAVPTGTTEREPGAPEVPDARSSSEMEELEPRPMSQAGHERVDREREMHEAAKKEKGWFGSLQKRLSRRAPGTKKKEKGTEEGTPMPNVAEVDEFQPADNDSISSISSIEQPASVRDVALAGTVSGVSSDDEAEPSNTAFVGGAGLEAIDATRQPAPLGIETRRYVDTDDSSSTSSGDLYTTEPRYKGLTSATYNPGADDDGLGMPAFLPETQGRRYSTSSDSSLESNRVADQTFGESLGGEEIVASGSGTAGDGEVAEGERATFGQILTSKIKKSFDEFSKGNIEKEEEKEKEEQKAISEPASKPAAPITEVVPPTPREEVKEEPFPETKDAIVMPAANAEAKPRASSDSMREKRSSRFSEIL